MATAKTTAAARKRKQQLARDNASERAQRLCGAQLLRQSTAESDAPKTASDLNSVDFSFGDVNNQNLDIHDMRWREAPNDLKEGFKQARRWVKGNEFIKTITRLRNAFTNYGFRLLPQNPAQAEKFDDWKRANGAAVLRYVGEVVNEWNMQDNVISFWRDRKNLEMAAKVPFLLLAETVKYTDAMGCEKLAVCLGYSKKDLQENADQLSDKEVRRYSTNEILLDPDQGENFRVLTRGYRGQGLCWPEMYAVFRTASQEESMQVGESLLAFAGRTLIEQHKIGFEARNSVTAQSQGKLLYSSKRAAGITKEMNGKIGYVRMVTQFDHSIGYVWVDPKNYDGRKWQTIWDRFMVWAGPLGYMLMGKGMNPALLGMLETTTVYDREHYLKPHLEDVLNASLLPKDMPCQIKWSNRCFKDQKLAWSMVSALLAQGPLSLRTGLAEGGFDPEQEAGQKLAESNPADKDKYLPLFDASHGKRPGEPGRPPASKNGDGKQS